jgi:hypothetical protein
VITCESQVPLRSRPFRPSCVRRPKWLRGRLSVGGSERRIGPRIRPIDCKGFFRSDRPGKELQPAWRVRRELPGEDTMGPGDGRRRYSEVTRGWSSSAKLRQQVADSANRRGPSFCVHPSSISRTISGIAALADTRVAGSAYAGDGLRPSAGKSGSRRSTKLSTPSRKSGRPNDSCM